MTTSESTARTQAIQAVVDRVSSYQDGAPEPTIEAELRSGLQEAGVDLNERELAALTKAIESAHGNVSVADVLPS
ncbi:hypothetical protein [Nocardioides sp.]|uniref:hypothetical protein n=1 Tax=Nocardioides sp. TaxID=35761 RepID=UPI003D0CFC02